MIKKWWQRLVAWYRKDAWGLNFLLLLVIVGAFLRLYKLPETFMFEGDQARDILLVRERILSGRPIAIGPVTSVGNMYLGPFYYYFMVPWVLLGNFAPVAPAIGVALMNVLTIILIYLLGKKMVGKRAAMMAAILFTFSNTAVIYGRFSWNPNLSPLFAVLVLYCLWRAWRGENKFWPWTALAAGLLIQLHYVNLIMVGVTGLIWLSQAIKKRRDKNFWLMSVLALVIFGLTLVPQVLFDFKHRGINSQAGVEIFTGENHNFYQGNLGQTIAVSFREMWGKTSHVVADLLIPKIEIGYYIKIAVCVAILILFVFLVKREKNVTVKKAVFLVASFIVATIIGVSFYQHTVFDHYLLFVLPLTALMFGYLFAKFSRPSLVGKIVVALILGASIFYNVSNYDFSPQGLPMSQKEMVVDYLIAAAAGQNYNIIRLPDNVETGSGGDIYASKYRYLALLRGVPPVEVGQHDAAEIMFVLDENLQTTKQDVKDSPIYELVLFGREKIIDVAQPVPDGPLIYKLVK